MKVSDIMTHPVITVAPETTIGEAAELMVEHRISGLPVVNIAGEIVGIVTEGDLLRRAETGTERRRARWLEFLIAPGRLASEYAHAHGRRVGEVMTDTVLWVGQDDAVAEVVELMERRRIKRVPVIDRGRPVGIVSRANLVRALVRNLPRPDDAGAVSDIEIRDCILAEIAKQPWGPRASVDVRVANGVVELRGAVLDTRERPALRVLAENTPGVKEVRDHLTWVEPLSGFIVPADGSDGSAPER
ncbi:MAG: CBS domain-containing protein [Alphaproteobacteria bacterium]